MTEHQRELYYFLKTGPKTKAEIVNNFKYWYYANASKHIGDVLGRMVNAGMIYRVKKGLYAIGRSVELDNEHQLKLF